ncbi:hypothetical protein CMO94_04355 [Candidatus Woesearchaeota archaeon]|jgi:hypothetical protein|nr:hypothetical protein [Candidatus Woesearchaeota archaeon]|tara:strand:- start:1 stop:222 length:222 start_codon:yes stop_codon:yes gene_type:complete
MEEIWSIIKKHPKTYIITISLIATIFIINETLEFAERINSNILLTILSLIIFYFFARIIIGERIDENKKKQKG